MGVEQKEHFTENTLFKVYDVLRITGDLPEEKAREVINEMQNQGILFRERSGNPKVALRRGSQRQWIGEEDDD